MSVVKKQTIFGRIQGCLVCSQYSCSTLSPNLLSKRTRWPLVLRYAVEVSTQSLHLWEKSIFICQDSHVWEMNSPLLCHQCIEFQQDNGWYFEECKRLTQRGVYWFLFLQEYLSPAVSTLYYYSYSSPFLKKKVLVWYFWTGWHGLLLIFIWAKLWGNVRVYPKILKHFSLSFLFLYIYIYSIYTIFCC